MIFIKGGMLSLSMGLSLTNVNVFFVCISQTLLLSFIADKDDDFSSSSSGYPIPYTFSLP
jgi:hypothetical protein